MYKQTRQPNLSTKGVVGFCLKYARNVFNIPVKYPKAWTAWQNSKQHKNRDYPKDVAVFLWFSYFIGSENYGHVVVSVPKKGLYSSPYRTTQTHAVLSSISEVERIYHCKYVGWSVDANGVSVAKHVIVEDMFSIKWNGKTRKETGDKWASIAKYWFNKDKSDVANLKTKVSKLEKTISELKSTNVQERDKLTSQITEIKKDLDIAERKAIEDDDTNEKVTTIFNYFADRWATFRDFLSRSK